MINDRMLQPLYDKYDQVERLHSKAVADLEEMRKALFAQVRDYNRMVTERDNLLEEVAFIREEIGEEAWDALVGKYERINDQALVILSGARRMPA